MAALINSLKGVDAIVAKIQAREATIAKNVENGLKKAGLMLQRESQLLVPVDLGNLKASAYTRSEGSGWDTKVKVGYTANYALYVHEDVEMKLKGLPRPKGRGHYWDPQGRGQAKFLEEPARRLRSQIKDIIKEACKL